MTFFKNICWPKNSTYREEVSYGGSKRAILYFYSRKFTSKAKKANLPLWGPLRRGVK